MTAPLFDTYIMVDWSAASSPTRGADSIWWASFQRQNGQLNQLKLDNPVTRTRALSDLADHLSDLMAQGQRVLVGFDFCFGLPRGVAPALGCKDWRGVWQYLAHHVRDDLQNANNCFELAARLNNALSNGNQPFWGCPAGRENINLSLTRPEITFNQLRHCDKRAGAKSVFQIHYSGAVGSQSLLGMPSVWQLRQHPWLAQNAQIWPFETGFQRGHGQLIFAEIYPRLVEDQGGVGFDSIKDRAQVIGCCHFYANADETGQLAQWFQGPADVDAETRADICREEGWILGLEGKSATKAVRPKLKTASDTAPDTPLDTPLAQLLKSRLGFSHAPHISGVMSDLPDLRQHPLISDSALVRAVLGAGGLEDWQAGAIVLLAGDYADLGRAQKLAALQPPSLVICASQGQNVTPLKAKAFDCPHITTAQELGGSDAVMLIWDYLLKDQIN